MAIAQLFFKKGNFIGSVELDVIIREGATAAARITKNPIENGADVNDHVIIDPMSFIMEGAVSDVKLNFIQALGQANSLAQATSSFTKLNLPSKEAWEELLQLQASKTPFELVTNLKTYPNILIQSITTVQDKDTSNALFFTASLSEIILVGAVVAGPEQFNDPNIADKAIPAVNSGQVNLGE